MALFFLRFSFVVFTCASCVRWNPPIVAPVSSGSCRSATLQWFAPDDAHERARLDAWCSGVGEAASAIGSGSGSAVVADISDVVFVSWNVHVGSGDIRRFVEDLRTGLHTGGRRFPHYVLLLQEAVREGGVPAFTGAPGATRIAPHVPVPPSDIVRVSADLDTSLIYVPSMRNGNAAADPPEDRGSAILSTLPLSEPIAIELPGERQRRVVIVAKAASISVAVVHLDALGGLQRLRGFWTPWMRDVQVRSTASLLPPDGPLVVGADLNTWHGRDELAPRFLGRLFQETSVKVDRQGLGLRVLDYMYFRAAPHQRARYRQLEQRYGSDHRPLVGWVE